MQDRYKLLDFAEYKMKNIFWVSPIFQIFHEPLDVWNNGKRWETNKIFNILLETVVQ